MGRAKTINREQVLEAAERVVSRDGAVNMTLEAVAAEAGISKGSVLYDCKSKKALIIALIERRIEMEQARVAELRYALGDVPDAALKARLASAFRSISEQDRAVGTKLAAALAQEPEFREPIQKAYKSVMAEILASSQNPRGAFLAFLAVEGFKMMDWFGFYSWSPEEAARLRHEISWLAGQCPDGPVMEEARDGAGGPSPVR